MRPISQLHLKGNDKEAFKERNYNKQIILTNIINLMHLYIQIKKSIDTIYAIVTNK